MRFAIGRGKYINVTPREAEILDSLARGHSVPQIARFIAICEGTVRVHIGRVRTKIRGRDQHDVLIWAIRHGFPRPAETPSPRMQEPATHRAERRA